MGPFPSGQCPVEVVIMWRDYRALDVGSGLVTLLLSAGSARMSGPRCDGDKRGFDALQAAGPRPGMVGLINVGSSSQSS